MTDVTEVVDALLAAMTARDASAARALVGPLAWEKEVGRFVGQVVQRGEQYARGAARLEVSERAAVVIEQGKARVWVLGEVVDGAWRVAGVTSERATALAFVVRWIDGTTKFDELALSIEGAMWATELATRLNAGESARVVLERAEADAAVRAASIARIENASLALQSTRVAWAALGARALKPSGRVSVGLAARSPDGESETVWLTVEDGGPPWTLVACAGTASLRPLLADRVDAAYQSATGLSEGPPIGGDALTRLIERVVALRGADAPIDLADKKVALLVARMARSLAARQGGPLGHDGESEPDAAFAAALDAWLAAASEGRATEMAPSLVAQIMAAALRAP